jgi:hypothetical protein
MTRRCTFHVGMHKTGSTSIQTYLYHDLKDPRYQYLVRDIPNGSAFVASLFADPPRELRRWMEKSAAEASFDGYRKTLQRQWDQSVATARQRDAHLIFSAEASFLADTPTLARIRDRLSDSGFATDILAYLRSWTSFHESYFQQLVKMGRGELTLDTARGKPMLYRENLENLWNVFGRETVQLVKFDPARFPQGCVVRDFQNRLGMPCVGSARPRTNEALTLPAVQLLYAYNKFGPHAIQAGRRFPPGFVELRARVATIAGDRVHFHSSFLKPFYERAIPYLDWVEREAGISLHEPIDRHDDQPTVRCEDDLFRFSQDTLEWLARATGQRTLRVREGEAAAIEVAAQMEKLRTASLTWHRWFRKLRSSMATRWKRVQRCN